MGLAYAGEVEIPIDTTDFADYAKFLQIKALPRYRFVGRSAFIPKEYAGLLGLNLPDEEHDFYVPMSKCFDYQVDISKIAIRKKKFGVFAAPGLGKTIIMAEFVKHAARILPSDRPFLIISPLMVINQTMEEIKRFYGSDLPIEQIESSDLAGWLSGDNYRLAKIGITNYEALRNDVPQGSLGGLAADESSLMKSTYGKYGHELIRLGKGLEWKLALTGTPAPNDRVEYANHAVFLDVFPTTNSFLSKYFYNKGKSNNRWMIKPHGIGSFYRDMADWAIFLNDPSVYGWKDNAGGPPPIHIHTHDVELTIEQNELAVEDSGMLFPMDNGGIVSRSKMAQLSKGRYKGKKVRTNKNDYIKGLVDSWPDESTIIWCRFNPEQDDMAKTFPGAANIDGKTPIKERIRLIKEFQNGHINILLSKPKILGFGLNLQIATRHVFSTVQDSYEEFWQAIKRSNRVGSTMDLNVHLPITDLERPMVSTVLSKMHRIEMDTKEQEIQFRFCITR